MGIVVENEPHPHGSVEPNETIQEHRGLLRPRGKLRIGRRSNNRIHKDKGTSKSGVKRRKRSSLLFPRPLFGGKEHCSGQGDEVIKAEVCNSSSESGSAGSAGRKRPRQKLSIFRLSPFPSIKLERDASRSKDSKTSQESVTSESHGVPSDEDHSCVLPTLMERTKIVTDIITTPTSSPEPAEDEGETESVSEFNCATAILGHRYLERFCGRSPSFDDMHALKYQLPEDPTVQESIECIFASQLDDGLQLWDDEDHLEPLGEKPHELVSPALLQQSRLNRADRTSTFLSQNKKRYEQASLVYVGTFDPTIPHDHSILDNEDPLPCPCHHSHVPALEPKNWPQSPLLLRPTPGSGTRIKGVRFANSKEYLWEPGSHLTWSECLAERWGVPCQSTPRYGCCERCAVLPINNGNEDKGESLVIDFETDLFEGSFMLRLRFSHGTTPEPYDDGKGYFSGMNRRYQAVVRGRFKKCIPFTELVTGFQFNRPCGKLPAKWILRSGLKVLSFFAPQLDAKLEGQRPYSLTPLGSTPQSITLDSEERDMLECNREEPTEAHRTLLGEASQAKASLVRARARKKEFDRLFVHKSPEPMSDPSKIYTFEFLQHLFNFQDFSIELGNVLGSVNLEEILDGQPLQIMASHGDHPLWSFDVWHECLWDSAKRHEGE